jgi:polyisoprenoid-binding protein YceI
MSATTKWIIDPTHSEVQFKVKHLVISTVTGAFKKFEGTAETDGDNFENAQVSFSIDTDSIDTNQEQRDAHLKSPDFFDSAQYPQIKFESSSFNHKGGDDYVLEGQLTIKDVTKQVKLDVEFGGAATDGYGNQKVGFEISGKVNRKEFNLTWSAVTEAGSIVVADDVKLIINVQFVKQA